MDGKLFLPFCLSLNRYPRCPLTLHSSISLRPYISHAHPFAFFTLTSASLPPPIPLPSASRSSPFLPASSQNTSIHELKLVRYDSRARP